MTIRIFDKYAIQNGFLVRTQTTDAMLSTNTPAERDENARRVHGVVAFDPGDVWNGLRSSLDRLPVKDRRRVVDALKDGLSKYETDVRTHVRVGDAERLRAGQRIATGDHLQHLDPERAGQIRSIADINRQNREFYRQRS